MGGSDQWGNIVTGTELIRRKSGGEAFALTTPLIKKADGSKFGKTEAGNIWLDAKRTSPYKFYQFWLNASDEDSKNYIRIFTIKTKEEIESIEAEHQKAMHLRILQKELAKDITIRVHSKKDFDNAIETSEILFGSGNTEALMKISEADLLSVFEGIPQMNVSRNEIIAGINIVEFLGDKTKIFPSKGEARKMLLGGGVFLNKEKILDAEYVVNNKNIIKDKYILAQKGKKNYFLIILE